MESKSGSNNGASVPVVQRFRSGHDAYLHDVALDFYGKRLASCSVDRSIRIWDRAADGEGWVLTATLPDAHTAPVLKLCWAHPEFGQVLASCSSDCFVHVYEETPIAGSQQKKWVRRAAHADAKDEVTDVQFAPPHLGLKLASCSKDGVVRIYEAYDVVNLTMWQLQQEFLVDAAGGDCTSISWSSSMFDPAPLLVVGTKKNGASVWQYFADSRKWQSIAALPVNPKTRASITGTNSMTVLDVDWAPNIGRPYHLIATGSADGFVRIYRLSPKEGNYECSLVAELHENQSEIWRVSWNVTGTILASSGDDGRVLLWKSMFSGDWKLVFDATSAASSKPVNSSSNSNPAPLPSKENFISFRPDRSEGPQPQGVGSLRSSASDSNLAFKFKYGRDTSGTPSFNESKGDY